MKIYSTDIYKFLEKKTNKVNPILFYGTENSLIYGLIKGVYSNFNKKNGLERIRHLDQKEDKDEKLTQILNSPTLFSKTNFIVVKNPKENIVSDLEKITDIKDILIINGENIGTKSKIRNYFDNHKDFISVACYKLDKKQIKNKIDSFLNINNVNLEKDAYWFLIENINEDYLILESELEKLLVYKNSILKINDLRKLIIQKDSVNSENYFFNCAAGNSELILKEINLSNKSLAESYEIFNSLKRFIQILSNAVIEKESKNIDKLTNDHLPKYLFLKKNIFKELLKKTDLKKISKIYKIMQRAEYLLRSSSELHKEILERFLLNLIKIIN